MSHCTSCGHALGVGRYCTNCGSPIADRFESPATPAPAIAEEPETSEPPAPVDEEGDYSGRFPLFADETPQTPIPPVPAAPTAPVAPVTPAPPRESGPVRRTPWAGFWAGAAAAALVAVLIAGLAFWAVTRDDAGARTAATRANVPDSTSAEPAPTDAPPSSLPPAPSPTLDPEVTAPADPVDLSSSVTATAPVTAPDNEDISGNTVSYAAANMLDGDPGTAWRMEGDGTGQTLTLTLPSESVLTRVGLINGYAKVDRSGDRPVFWYRHNRRITSVRWTFDDGTAVTQSLLDTPQLQMLDFAPVRTSTVRLTLETVSAPGPNDGRDYTPISEVQLIGGTA